MATISKFYLLDAVSPNAGIMPSNSPAAILGGGGANDAAGASVARDANDVKGTSNPDVESTVTSNADQVLQIWGHRRFVTRPLAAHTFASADGNWTFSYARSESNLLHNQSIRLVAYAWRPSTGASVDGNVDLGQFVGSEPTVAATEQAESLTQAWSAAPTTIIDGDILVFDVFTTYTQGMSVAYTDQFAYDGITEASTTTCASFIAPPSALTLFTAPGGTFDSAQGELHTDPSSLQVLERASVARSAFFCLGDLWARRGPLWAPA